MKMRDTNLETKILMFPQFTSGIEKQFMYGGKKYPPPNPALPEREATDHICDLYPEFIEGNIMKYLLRFKTQKREEDLFKIATYVYLLWIKYFSGDVREENLKISKEARSKK